MKPEKPKKFELQNKSISPAKQAERLIREMKNAKTKNAQKTDHSNSYLAWEQFRSEINAKLVTAPAEPAAVIIARAEEKHRSPSRYSGDWLSSLLRPGPLLATSGLGVAVLTLVLIFGMGVFTDSRFQKIKQGQMIGVASSGKRNLSLGTAWNLELKTGFLQVKKADYENRHFVFRTESATGRFTLKSPVDLKIEHSLVEISVLGTVFDFTLAENFGQVNVLHGKVMVKHVNGSEKLLTESQSVRFYSNGFSDELPKKKELQLRQKKPSQLPTQNSTNKTFDILYLKSGEKLIGSFQGSDDVSVRFVSGGNVRKVPRDQIKELKLNVQESP